MTERFTILTGFYRVVDHHRSTIAELHTPLEVVKAAVYDRDVAELRERIEKLELLQIETANPGIDMEQVRAERDARKVSFPTGVS